MKVEKDNGKALVMANGRAQKLRRFSRNEFWKNIGCLVSDPTLGLVGLRLCEKEESHKIIIKKRNICSIRVKVYFY